MKTIKYYVSLNSPWTYLGSERLQEIAKRHGYGIEVKPARFGDVFAASGGLPLPKRAPQRQAYRMMELKRWRDYHGKPINLEPKHFPADETLGVRLVLATVDAGRNAVALMTEIGRAVWVREENIADETVLYAAAKRAGIDAADVMANAASAESLDQRYRLLTQEAVDSGVFGAPSYVLENGEIFWGQDRLDLLDWRLGRKN